MVYLLATGHILKSIIGGAIYKFISWGYSNYHWSIYLAAQHNMFDYYYSSPGLSDEEQVLSFMLKDYAHQIIILIIALRQGRYFTT